MTKPVVKASKLAAAHAQPKHQSAGTKKSTRAGSTPRVYESESPALMSLRLLAAPNPKDDLTDAELVALCHDPRRSPELIQHLIDFVKGM